MSPQVYDGYTGFDYDFGRGEELNEKLNFILNEAIHVFYYHKDGKWNSKYKDEYANMLKVEIEKTPSLIKQLKQLEDRVVKMVTYRAIVLLEENKE